MKQRYTFMIGTFFIGLAVAMGAFGAHALKPMLLANSRVEAYETAVRYQLYHGFALLMAGVLMQHFPQKTQLSRAALCWTIGTLFFSGSLYALSFMSIGVLATLTPLGGIFFLVGWVFLFLSVMKNT